MSIEISRWLQGLSYSRYESAFRAHKIVADQLARLSDKDLRTIGVASARHRLAMLNSIKAQNTSAAGQAASQPTELRQLTVMFCDLVDSTALARLLDPEDFRDVILAYQQAVVEVVCRYEGHVAQYLGDGLMVYFGYPTAHEDDAVRAAHTAIELPEAIANLNRYVEKQHGVKLALRTGISTGKVVVGHIGANAAGDVLASGSTPNEAAHCQCLAKPDSNVISQQTREIIGDRFTCVRVPMCTDESKLKQGMQGHQLFSIVGINVAESRFTAVMGQNTSVMVGRDRQLDQLRHLWSAARNGEASAVLVRGEAGLGKSRLVQALIEEIAEQDYRRIVYQCSPYHIDTPLYPAIQHMSFAANIGLADDSLIKKERLGTLLEPLCSDSEKAMMYLAPLFGIDSDSQTHRTLPDLSVQEIRDETMGILLNLLTSLAKDRPVLFVLEDAHWLDATTQALLDIVCSEVKDKKILLLITARPEYQTLDSGSIPGSVIDLEKLQPESSRSIVHQLCKQKALPDSVVTQIIERTDGVPLFVEELTKMLLESNLIDESSDTCTLNMPISDAHIPMTLHDSFIARLDAMNNVKEIAQIASCVGREFEHTDIAALSTYSHSYLHNSLSQLIDARIISRIEKSLNTHYSFKHMLVRDAAYASLPKNRKKSIHRQLYRVYKDQRREPDLLAIHAKEAGQLEDAIRNWDVASEKALKRAAFSEAIAHLNNALSCVQSLPETSANRTMELELLVRQSHASTALKGFAHPHTVAITAKARALLHGVAESRFRFPVLYGHWVIQHAAGLHQSAFEDGKEMLAEAKTENNRAKDIVAHRVMGATQTMMGDFGAAILKLEHALSRYDADTDNRLASQYNLDPSVSSRIYAALCSVCVGQGESAALHTHGLVAFTQRLDHQHTTIYTLLHLALIAQIARWPTRARDIEQANEIVERYDLMAYRGHGLGIKAMMQYEIGDLSASLQTMGTALDIISATKTYIYTPLLYANYAACLADVGEITASEEAISKALSISERNSEYWAKAEVLRLAAHCAMVAKKDNEVIDTHLLDAIDVAENQGAKMWALRATISLAERWQDTGKSRQARDRLQAMMLQYPKNGYCLSDWHVANRTLDQLNAGLN